MGFRRDLDGVCGLDFVRGRAGDAVLADGFDGDPTRGYAGDTGTLSFEGGRDGDGGIRDIIKSDQTNEMKMFRFSSAFIIISATVRVPNWYR